MNGNQSRFCRDNFRNGGFGFRLDGLAGKIQEAAKTIKSEALEGIGWIGAIGFGIYTVGRIVGVV